MSILAGIDAGIHVGWHGIDEDTTLVPGAGVDGVMSLALGLQHGYRLTWRWPSDIQKASSGAEQRRGLLDAPKESYSGSAVLLEDEARDILATLAQYAAQGQPFLLGLPHEAMSIRAASSGAVLPVPTTALTLCDWKKPGQRGMVVRNRQSVDVIVQSTDADSITLDVDPGELGKPGGMIMPVRPVLLEPKQSFARHRTKLETWNIEARAVSFDFAGDLATLELGPITTSAGLENAIITARHEGAPPTVHFVNAFDNGAGFISETSTAIFVHFEAGVTTNQNLIDLMATSMLGSLSGVTNPLDTMQVGDAFSSQTLTGGDTHGPIGTGASVTTYADNPVLDRRLSNQGTNTDSIDSRTQILDFDNVPYAVALADVPDGERAVQLRGRHGAEYQWLKLFLATTQGPRKAFWLPTWRDDLPFVSKATNQITVEARVNAHYPAMREHVQIVETDGTITRAQITAAVNNGDGTWTLTIGTTLATSSVSMISWLELCRFNATDFVVAFDRHGWSMSTVAKSVQE